MTVLFILPEAATVKEDPPDSLITPSHVQTGIAFEIINSYFIN